MQSKATTIQQYLAELPAERREAIATLRQVILKNLDQDYEEGMQYGMIGYFVPHRVFPPGYHCDSKQPLPFVCLASQKNYMSLYMMSCYGNPGELKRFQEAWAKAGKKLDMGKSCIRFKRLEDIPLDVIGDSIRRVPVKKYLAWYEQVMTSLQNRPKGKPTRPAAKTKRVKAAKPIRKRAGATK